MDMPVQVPVDDLDADTEWNDILRKHGVIPEKPPSPTPMIEKALLEARELAHQIRLEGKNLDELDELEDEEDEAFLEEYRKKRLDEISSIVKRSKYGQVVPVHKPEYAQEVTKASLESFVLVLLTSSAAMNPESIVMERIWHELAARYGDVKFCQIRANLCIENYPDKNTPTILVYRDEDIKRQIVTLKGLHGHKTAVDDFERELLDVGAIQPNDFRLREKEREQENIDSHDTSDIYDSDWD